MRKIIKYIGSDGYPVFVERDAAEAWPAGAVEVTRMPGPFEDFVGGKWVYDAKGHADDLAGPEHIAKAHDQKRWEALLIRSGVTLVGGLLTPEAVDRKITLAEMVDIVSAKSAEFEKKEIDRQKVSINEPTVPQQGE